MVQLSHAASCREGDFLVAFGVDSTAGRMVARVLMWLLLLQPIYVAVGAEIEEPTVDAADAVEEPVASEAAVAEPEPDKETSEQAAVEITDVAAEDVPATVPNDTGEDAADEVAAAVESVKDPTDEPTVSDDVPDEMAATNDVENPLDAMHDDEAEVDESALPADDQPDVPVEDANETNADTDPSANEGSADIDVGTDVPPATHDEGGGGSRSSGGDEEEDVADDTAPLEDDADMFTDGTAATSTGAAAPGTASSTTEAAYATTTEWSIADATEGEVRTVAQDPSSKYVFGEGDCTLVADGEFYCVSADAARITSGDPRVYAEKDREGDREIFYFDGVEVKRITNNGYDDFAPVFEEEQQRIVWQAMINDRLQIMLHELSTNTTRQVTTSRQNSSNPDIEHDAVVWQEWVDTNWEIMMTNIDNDGGAFEIERLTDNAVHDMFPQAYDGLITWQREKGTSWEVIVYDLRSGRETALKKSEDTKYENPRFVLLFDSKHENGDVETIGYDLETGEMMELGTRAKPLPRDPVTPDDKTGDALPREAATSTKVKVGREDEDPASDTLY